MSISHSGGSIKRKSPVLTAILFTVTCYNLSISNEKLDFYIAIETVVATILFIITTVTTSTVATTSSVLLCNFSSF